MMLMIVCVVFLALEGMSQADHHHVHYDGQINFVDGKVGVISFNLPSASNQPHFLRGDRSQQLLMEAIQVTPSQKTTYVLLSL